MSHFDENILVTGSNGFIGAKVVEVLLKYGCRYRCFVRPSSQRDRLMRYCADWGGCIKQKSSQAT
jgi:nucleoside-diphosphate-sugar epimerase